jgi:hypothetical protein
MGLADDIRDFAYEKYIKPARQEGVNILTIRAGDIHEEMGLKGKLPSVCGSLGTKKFLNQHNLTMENREGPSCGADVFFTYMIK